MASDHCFDECVSYLKTHPQLKVPAEQACDALCHTADDACTAAVFDWVSNSAKGLKAVAASEDPITYISLLIPAITSAMNITAGGGGGASMALQSDYFWTGHHDRCISIPDAQYCHASPTLDKMQIGTVAFCVPSACSAAVVSSLLHGLIPPTNGSIPYTFTTTCGDQTGEWEIGTYIMLVLCGLLILMALVACLMDVADSSQSHLPVAMAVAAEPLGRQLVNCFSVSKNYGNFLNIRNVATNSLDGMRTLSMSWVVFGHTLIWPIMAAGGYSNIEDIIPIQQHRATLMGTWTGQAVQSAEFSVDTFFYMSGFLALYVGLKKLSKLSPLQVLQGAPLMYLDRWLRLTPLYMFIVWFYVYVIPVTSTGPYWSTHLAGDVSNCKEYWWQNILYIQTIYTTLGFKGGSCYGVSWYLADDMMFFYLVPLIICLALISTSLALVFLGTAWTGSILYTLIETIQHHWSAGSFDTSDYSQKYYQPPWTRCPPYLMGAAFGIIWFHWHDQITTTVSSRRTVRVGLLLASAFLLLSTVYGLAGDADSVPTTTSRGWMALYVTFSKPAWTLGLICLNILCFTHNGGAMSWILQLPIFGYLGKLSYSMYLLHPTVLVLLFSASPYQEHYSIVNFTRCYIAALTLTTAGGFVLHLLVELPCGNLTQLLLTAVRQPRAPKQDEPGSLDQHLVEEAEDLPNSPMFPACESRRDTEASCDRLSLTLSTDKGSRRNTCEELSSPLYTAEEKLNV